MKRKVNARPGVIFVFLLVLVAVAGCRTADVEQAAAVNETESRDQPASTNAAKPEAASPKKRGAEAGDGAMAKSGKIEVRAGNGGARAGDVVAGDGKVRAGEAVAGNGKAKVGDVMAGGKEGWEEDAGVRPGRLRLKIGGSPGTQFSGTCAIGEKEQEISGQTPARFVYEPEGREVACEIQNGAPDAGPLKFSVTAKGGNQRQKVKVTGDTISFSSSGDSISYSTSSASGNVVQKSRITSSSSSSSVSSSSSR